MNLVQNIQTLRQAVEDDRMPLKTAAQFLLGLQKVYLRRMMYLHEDSKSILTQLQEPFKSEDAAGIKAEIKTENVTTKKKRRDGAAAAAASNPVRTSYKLDLKNSAWWKAGFTNAYLQQQLAKFQETVEKDGANPKVEDTFLGSLGFREVRAKDGSPSNQFPSPNFGESPIN